MLYFIGFLLGNFLIVGGAGWFISNLHKHSQWRPPDRENLRAPEVMSRAVVSYALVLPFAALAFLILCFSAVRAAQNLGLQGHRGFVALTLFIPTVSFLTGYYYFKKVVKG